VLEAADEGEDIEGEGSRVDVNDYEQESEDEGGAGEEGVDEHAVPLAEQEALVLRRLRGSRIGTA